MVDGYVPSCVFQGFYKSILLKDFTPSLWKIVLSIQLFNVPQYVYLFLQF